MLVLGIDTSSPAVGVALVELAAGAPPRRADWQVVDLRRHGELLATGIQAVLAELGARPGDVGAVAVGLGPGPYTGLRVGVVTAVTFAAALGVPVYGVCSLDAVGDGLGARVVVTDARRREVYWARYAGGGERVAGPAVTRAADLAEGLRDIGFTGPVIGAGALLYATDLAGSDVQDGPLFADPGAVVRLSAIRALAGEPGETPVPLYLRRPDATPPGAPKRATGRPPADRPTARAARPATERAAEA